jgi:superfamily II DNA/RNA helicase
MHVRGRVFMQTMLRAGHVSVNGFFGNRVFLGLAEPLSARRRRQGYDTPTPIQAQAIPAVLKGGDLLAGAQTGTGKTAGFTLPMLQRLAQPHAKRTHAAASPSAP